MWTNENIRMFGFHAFIIVWRLNRIISLKYKRYVKMKKILIWTHLVSPCDYLSQVAEFLFSCSVADEKYLIYKFRFDSSLTVTLFSTKKRIQSYEEIWMEQSYLYSEIGSNRGSTPKSSQEFITKHPKYFKPFPCKK